ncbi:hypothetical protein C1Y63_05420 [Corynebacterium sp. 13CS0277]|nr:hypothetical protein C1Y63_05420 [Corynebacterium sp. 13CS0277]
MVMLGYNHEALEMLQAADTPFRVIVAEEEALFTKKGLAARSQGLDLIERWMWCEYQRDDTDVRRLAAQLREEYPDAGRGTAVAAVLPGLEYAVAPANTLAALLGLRCVAPGVLAETQATAAQAAATVGALTNKLQFRTHVGGPRWVQVHSVDDLLPPPCVLKPADRQASVGVSLIHTPEDIPAAWEHTTSAAEPLQDASRDTHGTYMCEELLTGQEYSVECLVIDGTPRWMNVTEKTTAGVVELGHTVARTYPEVEAAMRHLIDALQLADQHSTVLLHAEFIGTTPVECAGRPPGDRIARLISRAWGFNLYEAWARALCGLPVDLPRTADGEAAIRFLFGPPGIVTAVHDPSGRAVITAQPGTVLRPVTSSWERAGFVEADSAAEAFRLAAGVRFSTSTEVVVYFNHRRTPVEYGEAFAAHPGAVLLTDGATQPAGVVDVVRVDTADAEAVRAALADLERRYDIRGVVTFSDRDVAMVARVAHERGLPGPTPEAAHKARNKYAMRQAVRALDPEAVPDCRLVDSADTLDKILGDAAWAYPCVMKPVDSSGSRGFHLVDSPADARAAWAAWPGPMVIEELLTGTEHSAEGYVADGRIHLLGVTDKTTEPVHRLEIGQVFPSATPGIEQDVWPLVETTVRATGIDNCAFHLEFFRTPDRRVRLVEIAARPGGDFIASHLVPLTTGVSFAEDVIRIATGSTPSGARPRDGYVAATVKLHTAETGVLRSVGPLPPSPAIVEVIHHAHPGDRITQPPADTISPIIAEVILVAGSHEELAEEVARLRAVDIVVDSDTPAAATP